MGSGDNNINELKSTKGGMAGLMENVLRKGQYFGFFLFVIPIAIFYIISIGFASLPAMLAWHYLVPMGESLFTQALLASASLGIGFFFGIFALLIIVPILNFPFIFLVKPYRGPWLALESVAWYYHNALFYLVRYTVLDLITPSPISQMFFMAMGMKIGKGSMINTSNVSDLCLIRLGDYVTVGGSVFMMAHYAQKGFVVIEPLEIGDKTTIGLNAILMGGVKIGNRVTIAPGATVLPKTVITDGTKYGYEGLK